MKHLLIVGATALLCACGEGQTVHTSASIGNLVKPGTAPWLTVANGPDRLDVHGLDHKLVLEPTPDISSAVQSQLGEQLQPSYVQDLVVTCTSLSADMRVDQDKAPGNLAMKMGLHCAIWAHGFDANHDYQAQVSAPVGDPADQAYAQALPKLLALGAGDIAGKLRSDIRKMEHPAR